MITKSAPHSQQPPVSWTLRWKNSASLALQVGGFRTADVK
jgi:hypothetical protein